MKTINNSKRLRVLIVISNLGHGGAERQVIEIANNIDQARFDLHICSLSKHVPLAGFLKHRDTQLHIVSKNSQYDISVVPRLARLLKDLKIDIVHGFLFDAEIASRLAGLIARTKVVIGSERNTVHSYSKVQLLAYRLTKKLVDLCIANSKTGMQYNLDTFGLAESKYRVVYNGVDTERFAPAYRSELKAALKLPSNCFVLGMFGSFKPQKNHQYLLETIAALAKSRSDFRVMMVGGPVEEGDAESQDYYSGIKNQIIQLGLAQYCLLLGKREDVAELYNVCDITLVPSLFEGTPNVALESLASGVPVIATDVSDNRQVILTEKMGYIVSLNNVEEFSKKIDYLLLHETIRDEFGREARQYVLEKFSNSSMITALSEIYHNSIFAD